MMKRHCFVVSLDNTSNLCVWWGHCIRQRSKCNCRFRWTLTKHEGKEQHIISFLLFSSIAVFTFHIFIHSDITTCPHTSSQPSSHLCCVVSPLSTLYLFPVLVCVFLYATLLCLDLQPWHCFCSCICNLPWKFQPTHPGMQLKKHLRADLRRAGNLPTCIATYTCSIR